MYLDINNVSVQSAEIGVPYTSFIIKIDGTFKARAGIIYTGKAFVSITSWQQGAKEIDFSNVYNLKGSLIPEHRSINTDLESQVYTHLRDNLIDNYGIPSENITIIED